VIGSCGCGLGAKVDWFVEGCMPLANAPHMVLHKLTGSSCAVLSTKNRRLGAILGGMLRTRAVRRRLIKAGERLDVPFETESGPSLAGTPPGAVGGESRDWLPWPLPSTDRAERRRLLAFEDDAALASIGGVFEDRALAKAFWASQAWATALITWAPLALALLGALGLGVGLGAGIWLAVWLAIELLHAAELPFSLRAMSRFAARGGRARSARKTVLLTLAMGYPCWAPWALGVHDGKGRSGPPPTGSVPSRRPGGASLRSPESTAGRW
jgi:hypothetical protein